MHVSKLLHNFLREACPKVNKASLNRLMMTSDSLLLGSELSLTSLGRNLMGKSYVKHKIKSVDRLMGNKQLHSQRLSIYKATAEMIIGEKKSIEIMVDWSPCGNRKQQLLRASYFHQTRCAVMYEEVHPETNNNERSQIQRKFLNKLFEVIPEGISVTIITDAGFYSNWFAQVLALGWDYEGRVRGNTLYSLDKKSWDAATLLYKNATKTPEFIGKVFLSKTHATSCNMYLYKDTKQKKAVSKKPKLSSNHSKKYHTAEVNRVRKKMSDPWLIVSSKKHYPGREKEVMQTYAGRMKIEHDFRNTKNVRWGMGLDMARSLDTDRLEILLLIAALAMLMLWLVGLVMEKKGVHYRFQANTIKNKRVLSLIFLGLQIIKHAANQIRMADLRGALEWLQKENEAF